MGINSLHADHITRSGLGFGKSLRMILGIVLVLILMSVNGYVQAHRLVGQWQSTCGDIIMELNGDGSARVWTPRRGWVDYRRTNFDRSVSPFTYERVPLEWYANLPNVLTGWDITPRAIMTFRIRDDRLELGRGMPFIWGMEGPAVHHFIRIN